MSSPVGGGFVIQSLSSRLFRLASRNSVHSALQLRREYPRAICRTSSWAPFQRLAELGGHGGGRRLEQADVAVITEQLHAPSTQPGHILDAVGVAGHDLAVPASRARVIKSRLAVGGRTRAHRPAWVAASTSISSSRGP